MVTPAPLVRPPAFVALVAIASLGAFPVAAQVVIQERVEVEPASASTAEGTSSVVLSMEAPAGYVRYGEIVKIPLSLSNGYPRCISRWDYCPWTVGAELEGYEWGTEGRLAYVSRDLRAANGCNPLYDCLTFSDTLRQAQWDAKIYYHAGSSFWHKQPLFGYIWDYREQQDELDVPISTGLTARAYYARQQGMPPSEYTNTVAATLQVLPPWLEERIDADTVGLGEKIVLSAETRDVLGRVELSDWQQIEVGVYPTWVHPEDPEPHNWYSGGGGRIVNTRTDESSHDYLLVFYKDLVNGHVVYEAPEASDFESPLEARRLGVEAHVSRSGRKGRVERRTSQIRERLLARGVEPARVERHVEAVRSRMSAGGTTSTARTPVARASAPNEQREVYAEVYFDFSDTGSTWDSGYWEDGYWGYGYIYEYADVTLTESPVDLVVDSDNDGDLDGDDEAAEYADDRVGALLALNDDDDDGNGMADLDGPGGFDDDDLEPVELRGPNRAGAQVRLEMVEGDESVRLWADKQKSEEVTLPHVVPASDLPYTVYAEGVAWDSLVTVLRMAYEEEEPDAPGTFTETDADTLSLYSGPLGVSVPAEVGAGGRPLAVVTGLPPGTDLELRVSKNGTPSATLIETTFDLSLTSQIDVSSSWASPGDMYRVEAVTDGGALVLASGPLVVVPGPAATVAISAPVTAGADGAARVPVTLSAVDAYGNAVRDGTPVSWDLQGGGSLADTSSVTVGGEAVVTVGTGSFHGVLQDVTVQIDGVEDHAVIENLGFALDLTSSVSSLQLGSGGTTTITATVTDANGQPAPDGTPITWSATKGRFTSTGSVSGGTASAVLTATGAPNATAGTCLVSAATGNHVGRTEIAFAPADCFQQGMETGAGTPLHVVVGDEAYGATSGGYVNVEQMDGTVAQHPYWTGLRGTLRGEPNTVVRVTPRSEAQPFVTLYDEFGNASTAADGSIEVVLGLDGRGSYVVGSTGDFTAEDYPDAAFLRTDLDVTYVGEAPGPPGGDGLRVDGNAGALMTAAVGCDDEWARFVQGETAWTVPVVVAKKKVWGHYMGVAGKLFWDVVSGEAEGGAGLAGDLILGALPVVGVLTDGRDVLKEVARLWPGGEEPNAYVAGFAILGIASEFPPFKGGADQVIGMIKTVMKPLDPRKPLAKGILLFVKTAVEEVDVQAVLDSGPLFRRMVNNPSFRDLAEGTLVKNDGQFRALVSMSRRVGAEETETLLTSLLARGYSERQTRGALGVLGSHRLREESVATLVAMGKTDVVARSAAGRAQWKPPTVEAYVRRINEAGGAADPRITRFDQIADVQGSGGLISRSDFLTKGPQFEVDVALQLRSEGFDLVQLGRDVKTPGAGTEIDLIVGGPNGNYLVEAKNVNTSGADAFNTVKEKALRYKAFQSANHSFSDYKVLFFFDTGRPPTEAMKAFFRTTSPPVEWRPLTPSVTL